MSRALALLVALTLLGAASPAAAGEGILGKPGVFTCGGPSFPQSAFRNPTGAEQADDGPARALRAVIAESRQTDDPAFDGLPTRGWRVLVRSPDAVEFHAGRRADAEGFGWYVHVGRLEGDQWSDLSFGTCVAERVVPRHEVAPIGLSPAKLRRSTRTVTVDLTAGGCGGPRPERRFEGFEVVETAHTVTLLALLRSSPPPPGAGCPDIAYTFRAKVRLGRPLGRRAIRDASRFPARKVGRAR